MCGGIWVSWFGGWIGWCCVVKSFFVDELVIGYFELLGLFFNEGFLVGVEVVVFFLFLYGGVFGGFYWLVLGLCFSGGWFVLFFCCGWLLCFFWCWLCFVVVLDFFFVGWLWSIWVIVLWF